MVKAGTDDRAYANARCQRAFHCWRNNEESQQYEYCSASPISRLICYVATRTGKRSFVVSPATHGVTMDSSSALDVGRG